MEVKVLDFKRDVKNTRKGYFTLLVGGLVVKKCVAHKHDGGKIWFSPPAVQRSDGGYENVVCFVHPRENNEAQRLVAEQLAPLVAD